MDIKMTNTACGPLGSFQAGRIYTVDPELGLRLVEAQAATDVSVKETATASASEKADGPPKETTAKPPKEKRG